MVIDASYCGYPLLQNLFTGLKQQQSFHYLSQFLHQEFSGGWAQQFWLGSLMQLQCDGGSLFSHPSTQPH